MTSLLETNKDLVIKETLKAADYCQELLMPFHEPFYKEKLIIKVDFSPTRRYSRGGKYTKGYGINIAANPYLLGLEYYNRIPDKYIVRCNEYASYESDPIIGTVLVTDPIQHLRIVVGHEVSHACQKFLRDTRDWDSKPHGSLFKSIYKQIRVKLNKELPNQLETKKRYDELIKFITKKEFNA